MVFVLKLSDPNAVQGLPPAYQVIARYYKTYNRVAKMTEDFVRFMGIPKSLAVCWEETVDYNDHLGVGERPETTPMKIRVVFNNYGITVVNLPAKLKNLFKSAAEKRKEKDAQSIFNFGEPMFVATCGCASRSRYHVRIRSLLLHQFFSHTAGCGAGEGIFSRFANRIGNLFHKGPDDEAATGSMQLGSQGLRGGRGGNHYESSSGQVQQLPAGLPGLGGGAAGPSSSSGAQPPAKPAGRARRASLSVDLGDMDDDWKKPKPQLTNTSSDSGNSHSNNTVAGTIVQPSSSTSNSPTANNNRRNSQSRRGSERRTSLGHELELNEEDLDESAKNPAVKERQANSLGLNAAQHQLLLQKGYAVFRDVIPISKEEQELLASVVGAYQWYVFLRYQSRAGCKFFTSFLFLFAPLLATAVPTDGDKLPGFKGLDDYRYFVAGLTFLIVDILEWLFVTFLFQFPNTKDIHSKVDYYRQLLSKDRMTLFLLFTFSWVAGVFMFNVSWNPFNAKKLAKKLYDIGMGNQAVVPVQSSYSAAEWANLKLCTGMYEDSVGSVDSSMWRAENEANFIITPPGVVDQYCAGAFLYPREDTQKLGTFFYGFVFDHCN